MRTSRYSLDPQSEMAARAAERSVFLLVNPRVSTRTSPRARFRLTCCLSVHPRGGRTFFITCVQFHFKLERPTRCPHLVPIRENNKINPPQDSWLCIIRMVASGCSCPNPLGGYSIYIFLVVEVGVMSVPTVFCGCWVETARRNSKPVPPGVLRWRQSWSFRPAAYNAYICTAGTRCVWDPSVYENSTQAVTSA